MKKFVITGIFLLTSSLLVFASDNGVPATSYILYRVSQMKIDGIIKDTQENIVVNLSDVKAVGERIQKVWPITGGIVIVTESNYQITIPYFSTERAMKIFKQISEEGYSINISSCSKEKILQSELDLENFKCVVNTYESAYQCSLLHYTPIVAFSNSAKIESPNEWPLQISRKKCNISDNISKKTLKYLKFK